MADINVFVVEGRLTRDAELKTVGAKGTALANFSIANNTGFGDYAKTQFFDCQLWGQQATALAQYLTTGKKVCVSGELEENQWEGNDGAVRKNWRINVRTISLGADPQNKRTYPDDSAPSGSPANTVPGRPWETASAYDPPTF